MNGDDHNGRNSWKTRHRSRVGDAQPGDENGTWTRERLERMDADFCHALERAIRSGAERVGEGKRGYKCFYTQEGGRYAAAHFGCVQPTL
jgi:hypothetical protein